MADNPIYILFKREDGTIAYPITDGSSIIGITENEDIKNIINQMENLDIETDKTLTLEDKPADSKTVGDKFIEINQAIEDLKYVPINIKSFSCDKSIVEIGSTVTSVVFNWSFDGIATSLTLDDTELPIDSKTYTLSDLSLKANKTYTLKAMDKKDASSSRTLSINFYNGVYFGAAAIPSSINASFILSLSKTLQNSKSKTFTCNSGSNQYIWYALPTRLGTPTFNVGGFDGGFNKVSTFNFKNSSGYSENYDVYRSLNSNLGNKTVKAS